MTKVVAVDLFNLDKLFGICLLWKENPAVDPGSEGFWNLVGLDLISRGDVELGLGRAGLTLCEAHGRFLARGPTLPPPAVMETFKFKNT